MGFISCLQRLGSYCLVRPPRNPPFFWRPKWLQVENRRALPENQVWPSPSPRNGTNKKQKKDEKLEGFLKFLQPLVRQLTRVFSLITSPLPLHSPLPPPNFPHARAIVVASLASFWSLYYKTFYNGNLCSSVVNQFACHRQTP